MIFVPLVFVEVAAHLLAESVDNSLVESVASKILRVILAVHVVQMLFQALTAEESYRSVMERAGVLSVCQ